MTNKKKQNTRIVEIYKQTKAEMANELGINGGENTEVNAKMASENESKYSKKTMNRKSHIKNGSGDYKGKTNL